MNHYDNIVETLPRFALKNMRTLINTYINNQIFSLKALKFSIYFIRNIIILFLFKISIYIHININNFAHCTSFYTSLG